MRILALEDDRNWQDALRMDSLLAFRKYLQKHEKGKYRAEAESRIQALLGRTPATPRPSTPKPIPSKRTPAPAPSFDRIKRILFIGLPILVVGMIVIWQLSKGSEQPSVWDCKAKYEECQEVESTDGIFYFVRNGDKWGYVNEKGEELIAPRFEELPTFDTSGLAQVKENGKYGWIDRKGQMVVPAEKEGETLFIDTLAGRPTEKDAVLSPVVDETPKEKPKVLPHPPADRPPPHPARQSRGGGAPGGGGARPPGAAGPRPPPGRAARRPPSLPPPAGPGWGRPGGGGAPRAPRPAPGPGGAGARPPPP
ncbi:MAG: WG repeat-containing protein [Saprospirales bacterium]|nr:WG repeat-containing protein [Saprospirales bacterium]